MSLDALAEIVSKLQAENNEISVIALNQKNYDKFIKPLFEKTQRLDKFRCLFWDPCAIRVIVRNGIPDDRIAYCDQQGNILAIGEIED